VQLGFMLIFTALVTLIYGHLAGFSAFLGGGVCFLSNLLYIMRVLGLTGAQSARRICRNVYSGEMTKLLVVMGLSLMVFRWHALMPLPYFLGFFVGQVAVIMTPCFIQKFYTKSITR
jgi:ATP synthase protein I